MRRACMLNAICHDSICSRRSAVLKQPQHFLPARHRGSTRSIPSRIPRLLPRKFIRFLLHSTPFTSSPRNLHSRTTTLPLSLSTGRGLLQSRPSSSSSSIPLIRSSHLHFAQGYRRSGPHKRFRIGVTAPLPPYFVQACQKLKIPLTDELIDGGVRIDDVRQDLSFLREGKETENDMRWLL